MSDLEPPTSVYDADCVGVRREGGSVSLYFGKKKSGGGLRSRVQIRYGLLPFMDRIWGTTRDFQEKLRHYVSAPPDTCDASTMDADKEHSDWANLEYLSFSATEACADFYRVSVAGKALVADKVAKVENLRIDAVLRVLMTVDTMNDFLVACEPIAAALEHDEMVASIRAKQEKDVKAQ